MIPYRASGRALILWEIKVSLLGTFVVALPTFGFFFCIVWSLTFNYEAATATHCRVRNYLPSISSTIGGFAPQIYVWRVCIALHCLPRFAYAFWHHCYYSAKVGATGWVSTWGRYSVLLSLSSLIHFVENLSLLFLTYVSSVENYGFHEKSFMMFVLCAQVYMILNIYLLKSSAYLVPLSRDEIKSLKLKKILFLVSFLSILLAAYFFHRHNTYCEPGVYTAFALCEYIITLSNIAFHATPFMWEFSAATVSLQIHSETQERRKTGGELLA